MIVVSVFYPKTAESQFDMGYYKAHHLPMIEGLLKPMGLQGVAVDIAVGTPMPDVPAPFSVVAHLMFNNMEEMEMGMGHHGAALMQDVPNFTNVQPLVQISKRG